MCHARVNAPGGREPPLPLGWTAAPCSPDCSGGAFGTSQHIDTALSRLLVTPPEGPEQAFQQAVACELLTEREALEVEMSSSGVRMLDVQPDELSLAAVNLYLDIKARGVL